MKGARDAPVAATDRLQAIVVISAMALKVNKIGNNLYNEIFY